MIKSFAVSCMIVAILALLTTLTIYVPYFWVVDVVVPGFAVLWFAVHLNMEDMGVL